MKKIAMFLTGVLLVLTAAIPVMGCKDTGTINIYMPDGAPALALAKLMHDGEEIDGKMVRYHVVKPDTITSYLLGEQADLAIVPTNAAAVVYNKAGKYRFVSANTHGNLYIVGPDQPADISDLKGKILGVIGQSGTPDMIMQYLMEQADIGHNIYNSPSDVKSDEISIRYYADGGDLINALKISESKRQVDYALLGEPAVQTALHVIQEMSISFDLADLWEQATGQVGYPQAGLVVKNGRIEKTFLQQFLSKMQENVQWIEDNPALARAAIADNMLSGSATTIQSLSKETVRRCSIRVVPASEAKEAVLAYLAAIHSVNPGAVGGKLPEDGFFYTDIAD